MYNLQIVYGHLQICDTSWWKCENEWLDHFQNLVVGKVHRIHLIWLIIEFYRKCWASVTKLHSCTCRVTGALTMTSVTVHLYDWLRKSCVCNLGDIQWDENMSSHSRMEWVYHFLLDFQGPLYGCLCVQMLLNNLVKQQMWYVNDTEHKSCSRLMNIPGEAGLILLKGDKPHAHRGGQLKWTQWWYYR